MSRRVTLWLLLAVVVAGVGLRSWQLTDRSIWFDEAFTWRLSQFPVPELIARTAADAHPPLYYLMVKFWTWVFGPSLLALRSFSITFAGLTLAAAYLLAASAWKSRGAGLTAAIFMAVSAWQISFAVEARMYTLGTALTLFSTWLCLRQLRVTVSGKGSLGGWFLYALVAAIFLYVHNFALLVVATQAVFVLGMLLVSTQARVGELVASPLLRQASLAFLVVGLLYLPWVPVFLQQMSRVENNYWVEPLKTWSIPETAYQFFVPTLTEPSHLASGLALAIILLAFAWLVFGEKKSRDAAHLLTMLTLLPIIVVIAISLFGRSLYQDRFFVFFHATGVVAMAALVARLRFSRLRFAAVAVLLITSLVIFLRYRQEIDIPHHPGLAAAIETLQANILAGEPVFVSSPYMFLPTVFYTQHNGIMPQLVSDDSEIVFFAGGTVLKNGEVVSPQKFEETNTLWLVDTTGFGENVTTLSPPWRRLQQERFPEVFPFQGEVVVSHWQQ